MKIAEYNEMMAYLLRPAQQAKLVDDLEPGSLKDELLKDFDPSQETYEEYLRRKNLDRETLSEGGGQAFRLKKLQEAYDIFGQQKLDEAAKVLGFKDFTSLQGEKFANTRRKIFKELKQYGEVLPRYEADVRGRRTRIPKEQGIQIKLLEATNKKKFFDPKAFAKENKISLKQVKEEAKKLQRNIYKKRIVEASRAIGKETKDKLDWIPNDSKFSDNALSKLWKSKLIKYEREKIDELFFDAFGRKTSDKYNPKKFLAIKKNLNEYRQLRDAINKRYPKINFELDHPLSKSTLNKMFNATTDQLTRVNILEADLNNGFKDSLSLQYEKAIESKNLTKKKAVEKIARNLKLNIGKVSDDATNFKYGVKEFQKLNIKNEMSKAIQTQADLSSNFKSYVKKNPDLFKTAGINPNVNITPIGKRELTGMEKIIKSDGPTLGMNLGLGKALGSALKTVPTPAGALAITTGFGFDPTSAIDRAGLGLEAAFAPEFVKQSAKMGAAQRFFNLGLSPKLAARAARVASPLGIASLGLEGLYQYGKFAKDEIAKVRAMDDEERLAYNEGLMDEGGLLD